MYGSQTAYSDALELLCRSAACLNSMTRADRSALRRLMAQTTEAEFERMLRTSSGLTPAPQAMTANPAVPGSAGAQLPVALPARMHGILCSPVTLLMLGRLGGQVPVARTIQMAILAYCAGEAVLGELVGPLREFITALGGPTASMPALGPAASILLGVAAYLGLVPATRPSAPALPAPATPAPGSATPAPTEDSRIVIQNASTGANSGALNPVAWSATSARHDLAPAEYAPFGDGWWGVLNVTRLDALSQGVAPSAVTLAGTAVTNNAPLRVVDVASAARQLIE